MDFPELSYPNIRVTRMLTSCQASTSCCDKKDRDSQNVFKVYHSHLFHDTPRWRVKNQFTLKAFLLSAKSFCCKSFLLHGRFNFPLFARRISSWFNDVENRLQCIPRTFEKHLKARSIVTRFFLLKVMDRGVVRVWWCWNF